MMVIPVKMSVDRIDKKSGRLEIVFLSFLIIASTIALVMSAHASMLIDTLTIVPVIPTMSDTMYMVYSPFL
ncbi:hypothetical protein C4577_03310 [Candidatus Parcubacteria bacterium]|nr:MAG: hypothetical protein C4577_03310 [Candidatus Parcubacteria bacterium]